MSERLLTDEEIKEAIWLIYPGIETIAYEATQEIAKAQDAKTRKWLVEWGDNPCPHGYLAPDTSKASKHECPLCWQALEEME